jgi:hypothetical protein
MWLRRAILRSRRWPLRPEGAPSKPEKVRLMEESHVTSALLRSLYEAQFLTTGD